MILKAEVSWEQHVGMQARGDFVGAASHHQVHWVIIEDVWFKTVIVEVNCEFAKFKLSFGIEG